MGNVASFIKGHAKRFANRYNAQYRALKFLDREKLAKAPRHIISHEIKYQTPLDSSFHDFQKKDLELDEYLKNVYVRSEDKIPENSSRSNVRNPSRSLPESREPIEDSFVEPEDVVKGFCTLSQISQILTNHEEDPENNTPAAIAKNYYLDVDKVENLLKYHCIFKFSENLTSSFPVQDHDEGKTVEQISSDLKNYEKSVKNYYELSTSEKNQSKGKSEELEKQESKNHELKRKAIGSK